MLRVLAICLLFFLACGDPPPPPVPTPTTAPVPTPTATPEPTPTPFPTPGAITDVYMGYHSECRVLGEGVRWWKARRGVNETGIVEPGTWLDPISVHKFDGLFWVLSDDPDIGTDGKVWVDLSNTDLYECMYSHRDFTMPPIKKTPFPTSTPRF